MSVTCPRGHTSGSTDYCDVCGSLITPAGPPTAELAPTAGGSTAATGSPEPSGADGTTAEAGGVPCPRCGTVNLPSAGFCEDCGLNFSDPSAPAPAGAAPGAPSPAGTDAPRAGMAAIPAVPVAALSGWQAKVIADRAYFDRTDAGEIAFPADCPERLIPLPVGEVTIGRRSRSGGAPPVIDLAGPPEDIGVSHAHAALTQRPDGQWEITDRNSTNGTFIGDAGTPLVPGEPVTVDERDEIHVGAWTTITLTELETPPA